MAVLRSLAAVGAAPGLWWGAARAAAGLRGRCPRRGYAADSAQVRKSRFPPSRSSGLGMGPEPPGGREGPGHSGIPGLLGNGFY